MRSPGRALTRNPMIFIVAALLIVSGIVGAVGFTRVLVSGAGPVEVLYLVVAVIVALLSVYAGWLVLHQDERGRSLGLVLAVVGLVLALFAVLQGAGVFIATMLIDAFIVFVLTTRAKEFA